MADEKTYYAWSPIHYHTGEGDNLTRKIAKVGEQVSKDKLGVDDDEWDTLLEGGAIRPQKYPKGVVDSGMSPNEHRLRTLRLQREELEREIAGVGGVPGDTTPSETTGEATPAQANA